MQKYVTTTQVDVRNQITKKHHLSPISGYKRETEREGEENLFFYGSRFSSNFHGSRHRIFLEVGLELAVIAFLLDQLDVVMLAVESSLMCNVV